MPAAWRRLRARAARGRPSPARRACRSAGTARCPRRRSAASPGARRGRHRGHRRQRQPDERRHLAGEAVDRLAVGPVGRPRSRAPARRGQLPASGAPGGAGRQQHDAGLACSKPSPLARRASCRSTLCRAGWPCSASRRSRAWRRQRDGDGCALREVRGAADDLCAPPPPRPHRRAQPQLVGVGMALLGSTRPTQQLAHVVGSRARPPCRYPRPRRRMLDSSRELLGGHPERRSRVASRAALASELPQEAQVVVAEGACVGRCRA